MGNEYKHKGGQSMAVLQPPIDRDSSIRVVDLNQDQEEGIPQGVVSQVDHDGESVIDLDPDAYIAEGGRK